MKNMVEDNKKRIEKFDLDYYFKSNNYQMAAALSALNITNEIQLSYIKEENNLTTGDCALRLYALLQGLFVSIDSLYAIAYSLTKSKSFININNNPDLRALKYIRNDVVGHPSNRVINSNDLAYCILDETSINKNEFSYNIYSNDGIEKRVIIVNDILNSYYKEANDLLDELYNIATNNKNNTTLENSINTVINKYFEGANYKKYFDLFVKEYKALYPDSKKNQHRILWRSELINKLYSYKSNNSDINDVISYCIGLELIKIYELIFGLKFHLTINKKTPKMISSFYRFLNKNKELIPLLDYLKDSDHPLFKNSLTKIYNKAIERKIEPTRSYLKMILNAYAKNDLDLVYALALPIKEYKKK